MNEMQTVPFIVHEADMARMERCHKRMWIVIITLILLLAASNAAWLWAWLQYDYTSTTTNEDYWQDGNGYNNINTGEQGDVNNGAKVQEIDDYENEDSEKE